MVGTTWGAWGGVGAYGFSELDAIVACVSLGFPARGPDGRRLHRSRCHSCASLRSISEEDLALPGPWCDGSEMNFAHCRNVGGEKRPSYGDVAVTCRAEPQSPDPTVDGVRLTWNGTILTPLPADADKWEAEGRVELLIGGELGSVCELDHRSVVSF